MDGIMHFWNLLPPFLKGALSVVAFFISLGWASYGAVLLIVKAEGQDIRREIKEIRLVDIHHLDGRFDKIEKKLDVIIQNNPGRE